MVQQIVPISHKFWSFFNSSDICEMNWGWNVSKRGYLNEILTRLFSEGKILGHNDIVLHVQ